LFGPDFAARAAISAPKGGLHRSALVDDDDTLKFTICAVGYGRTAVGMRRVRCGIRTLRRRTCNPSRAHDQHRWNGQKSFHPQSVADFVATAKG
jgi:hypothetical protein